MKPGAVIAVFCVGAIAAVVWLWRGGAEPFAAEEKALQAQARRIDDQRASLLMTDGVVDSNQIARVLAPSVAAQATEIGKDLLASLTSALSEQLAARTHPDATAALRLAVNERGMRWLRPGDEPQWGSIIRTCQETGVKTDDAIDAKVLFERYLASQYAATSFRGIASSEGGNRVVVYRARTEAQCYDLMLSGLSEPERAFWFATGKTQLGLCFRIPVRTLASMLEAEGAVWVASSQTFVRQANGTVGQFHCVLVWDSQAKSWVPIQVSRRGEGSIVWY